MRNEEWNLWNDTELTTVKFLSARLLACYTWIEEEIRNVNNFSSEINRAVNSSVQWENLFSSSATKYKVQSIWFAWATNFSFPLYIFSYQTFLYFFSLFSKAYLLKREIMVPHRDLPPMNFILFYFSNKISPKFS